MNPYKLGVNGYAFIVTNNGYVLCHPDLRPVFQRILKPSYNSVDMAEVELVDDDRGPREFNHKLKNLRLAVINQSIGGEILNIKYHYDDMKRASVMKRKYFHHPIENSPFTLVISTAFEDKGYRVNARDEIRRSFANGENVTEYFGTNWKIHPEWVYCKYHYDTEKKFNSSEEEFLHFMGKARNSGWIWKSRSTVAPPEHATCDRDLVLSTVFDARVTKWFTENITASVKEKEGKEFKERFGITLVFLATRSGLTRWHDFTGEDRNSDHVHFSEIHNRAINEIWYKRAVEQYLLDSESFVYSVPFEVGHSNDALVTASHAVFHIDKSNNKAPAAVVGYQFLHSALYSLFFNVTSMCGGQDCGNRSCTADGLSCFVVDNNGYIVVSEDRRNTGFFFGEVSGFVMEQLVADGIFKRIHIYDYQAVCFRNASGEGNAAFTLLNPMNHLYMLGNWLLGYLIWLFTHFSLGYADYGSQYPYTQDDPGFYPEIIGIKPEPTKMSEKETCKNRDQKVVNLSEEDVHIKRTRVETCDQEVDLYQFQTKNENLFNRRSDNCSRPYVVQPIQNTNLILIVVNILCPRDDCYRMTVVPTEVEYNGTLTCHKVHSNDLPRKIPKVCINRHDKEDEIKLCGLASNIFSNWYILVTIISSLLPISSSFL